MTALAQEDGPSRENSPAGARRRAAYQRANWLLSGAGITLTLAGVPPGSPEVQAIRRALRLLNEASGLEKGRHERRAFPANGPA